MADTTKPTPWDYIKEFFKRLTQKSPRFFVVIQYISVIAFVLTGLPAIVEELGIDLSDSLEALQNKIVAYASAVSYIISKLAVINPENLPFTHPESKPANNDTSVDG
jgi:hypothetical protein